MKERYTFDNEKFKAVIAKKGLTLEKVNLALGRSHSYSSHGTIDKAFLSGLERYYGISGKDIGAVLNGGSKGPESGTEGHEAVDYDKLYKCIYSAVYQAVKKALSE